MTSVLNLMMLNQENAIDYCMWAKILYTYIWVVLISMNVFYKLINDTVLRRLKKKKQETQPQSPYIVLDASVTKISKCFTFLTIDWSVWSSKKVVTAYLNKWHQCMSTNVVGIASLTFQNNHRYIQYNASCSNYMVWTSTAVYTN